jgi:hypothetical protein
LRIEPVDETDLCPLRHWNAVVHTLDTDDDFVPLRFGDETGIARGTTGPTALLVAWDCGAKIGPHSSLIQTTLVCWYLFSRLRMNIIPDPEMRPYKEPMSAERREQLIVGMGASVPVIYRYFASHRRSAARAGRERTTHRRAEPKIGRNEVCPCGSGKKFKKCCGKLTLH